MEIIELSRGRTRAVLIPEAGGRLHQFSIDDGDRWLPLLHSPKSPVSYARDPLVGGSYAMAPWPGRIDGGRFLWRGRTYEVPVNRESHSIHGLGVYSAWQVESVSAYSCRLSVEFDEGWPWQGRAMQEIEVVADGIRQTLRLEAADGGTFPAGVGWHPWFRRRLRSRDDVRLLVDADRIYELAQMIPTGWVPRVNHEMDLRGYPVLGARRIDACYSHPRGPLRIRWGDIELTMQSSRNVTHAVVYTPNEAVCVEPQTCAPDAFNLAAQGVGGVGAAVVDERHPLVATTIWRWTIRTAR